MKIFIAMITGLVLLTGCNTVAPKATDATQASFDPVADAAGNHQNSGALGFYNHELIITPTARARYLALVAKYGSRFAPQIAVATEVIAPGPAAGEYLLTLEQVDHFATMSEWERNKQ